MLDGVTDERRFGWDDCKFESLALRFQSAPAEPISSTKSRNSRCSSPSRRASSMPISRFSRCTPDLLASAVGQGDAVLLDLK